MKPIYIVSAMGFSDYNILGVFEDKSDAETYVQTYNTNRVYEQAGVEEGLMYEGGDRAKFKWSGSVRLHHNGDQLVTAVRTEPVNAGYQLEPVLLSELSSPNGAAKIVIVSAEGWTPDEVRQKLEAKVAELKAASHA